MNPKRCPSKIGFGSALTRSTYNETDGTDLNWMTGCKRKRNSSRTTTSSSLSSRGCRRVAVVAWLNAPSRQASAVLSTKLLVGVVLITILASVQYIRRSRDPWQYVATMGTPYKFTLFVALALFAAGSAGRQEDQGNPIGK
jgi:hypothetical protein